MRKYTGVPELLEKYMEEKGSEERWITVREFCDRFSLTRYECNTVSGFLRRLESGPFGEFPYIVLRIERIERTLPSDPPETPVPGPTKVYAGPGSGDGGPGPGNNGM